MLVQLERVSCEAFGKMNVRVQIVQVLGYVSI